MKDERVFGRVFKKDLGMLLTLKSVSLPRDQIL
jgi:hypothetical protein